jgi:uncharacterized membrane protein
MLAIVNILTRTNNIEDPVTIVKSRLVKGEISKKEYDELRRAIQPK